MPSLQSFHATTNACAHVCAACVSLPSCIHPVSANALGSRRETAVQVIQHQARSPAQAVNVRGEPAAADMVCVQVVGAKHVLEEFRVGVTAVMLAAKQDIQQGNLKHKDLTGQEVSSQVRIVSIRTSLDTHHSAGNETHQTHLGE